MKKRIFAILLAVLLVLSVGVLTGAEETEPERTGDIVILFTSDVHCGVDQGFGYAGVEAVREYLTRQGDAVLLVDNGDSIQGEPIGTMTKGELPLQLMNALRYDVAIPGNHDYDYGMDQFLSLVEKADFPYVSCNFNKNGEPVLDRYVVLEAGGAKIAFVGVTTPKTLTSSTPRYFQDENGNFIYGFLQQDETGELFFGAIQSAVDDARAEGADYVVVLGHLGNLMAYAPYTYADVISHVSGIDAFLDGHSHDTEQVVMKDKDGKDVVRSACGTKLMNIGWCRIAADGTITTGLYTWTNTISAPDLLGLNNEMAEAVQAAKGQLADQLETVVAKTAVDLTIYDPEAVDLNGNPVRMIRRAETNLGDLVADAYRVQCDADIGIVGGGAIRVSIPAGDITMNDILSVHPFGNDLCVIEATGQQILDALEWGARLVPDQTGGFLQVSGLTYEIHTYIEQSCVEDENKYFVGITGERRVKNVMVGGVPIDPEATYTVAGNDYTLRENGDGYTVFDDCKLLIENVKLDNQALIDYITESLGGIVGAEYECLTGQGRIVIVETQP